MNFYDVGRGMQHFRAVTDGNYRRAAASLAADPRVLIITGFFIPGVPVPAAETDGPVGAVQLAATVARIGGTARILTDAPCAPVVAAAIEAGAPGIPLDVGDGGETYPGVSHVVAIERPGPSPDGVPRTMRGADMNGYTAPLHRVFERTGRTRIGVGDGGNELGMGALPADLVAAVVPLGARIRCTVGCDLPLVAGTSNWGAAALVAALAAVTGTDCADLLDPAWSQAVLAHMVARAGAVDGVAGAAQPTVDGVAWPEYAAVLDLVRGGGAPDATGPPPGTGEGRTA